MSITNFLNQILCGEALAILKQLPDESVDCVVTSPPYWALRDYGVSGQLGLETSFADYVQRLGDIFDEVKRLLKASGTCWINLGDTYSTRNRPGRWSPYRRSTNSRRTKRVTAPEHPGTDVAGKCLLQIPARVAIEMTRRGWILRNEIIWWKPNCMPESVRDRFTSDFEKLYFFVKSRYYYFERQFEPLKDIERLKQRWGDPSSKKKRVFGDAFISAINPRTAEASRQRVLKFGRNKRSVWRIATKPSALSHFAIYPPELIETPIKAGCPPGGIVLDPFVGSGTTAVVAQKLGRQFIGIDLNPDYVRMAKRRLSSGTL